MKGIIQIVIGLVMFIVGIVEASKSINITYEFAKGVVTMMSAMLIIWGVREILEGFYKGLKQEHEKTKRR